LTKGGGFSQDIRGKITSFRRVSGGGEEFDRKKNEFALGGGVFVRGWRTGHESKRISALRNEGGEGTYLMEAL